ncbi:hypothetical protein [Paraburkholderia sp. C35]|uniref:hypothetical protein n=1 Tax=Paraburkholderia sp. C35 TaxID=2126993 RepID=UPI000D698567|nr:hypothetical protein [Paraburkholderia sp. C35]
MPHIIIEATSRLHQEIDLPSLMLAMHRELADAGYAQLDDLKSRLHVCNVSLAGADPAAEFVVARLLTTNPRPEESLAKMARIIHDTLHDAITAKPRAFWWQCCVVVDPHERSRYLKTDSRTANL